MGSFRFKDLGDPAGKRVWWASEEGGRAIEQIYKGWTQRFDEQLQQIHQARLVIAEDMDEAGDTEKSTFEELERVAGNINGLTKRLREAEKENGRLEALLDAYQSHPEAQKRMNATVLKGNETGIGRIRKAIGALKQEYELQTEQLSRHNRRASSTWPIYDCTRFSSIGGWPMDQGESHAG